MDNVLSQAEVDALLQAVQDGNVSSSGEDSAQRRDLKVVTYNFRNPPVLAKGELRLFTRVHEEFCRKLGYRSLSRLKANFDMSVVSCEVMPGEQLSAAMSNPTYLVFLTMSPGGMRVVFHMELPVMLILVDAMLGGEDTGARDVRPLTAMELSITEAFADLVASQLRYAWEDSGAWEDTDAVRFMVNSQSMEPDVLQVFPPPTQVLCAKLRICTAEAETEAHVCYSYPVVQPLLDRMTGHSSYQHGNVEEHEDAIAHLLTVPLDMRAVVGRAVLPAGRLQELAPGTVICLDRDIDVPIDVFIDDYLCFKAEWGRRRGRAAIKLLQRSQEP